MRAHALMEYARARSKRMRVFTGARTRYFLSVREEIVTHPRIQFHAVSLWKRSTIHQPRFTIYYFLGVPINQRITDNSIILIELKFLCSHSNLKNYAELRTFSLALKLVSANDLYNREPGTYKKLCPPRN